MVRHINTQFSYILEKDIIMQREPGHIIAVLLSEMANITETSPYKSDPRFPPNIVKMGEIWGRNQNDKN